jgi:hypothetical protein
MNIRNLNRWQAFSRHFGFSLLLGISVFVLFRYLWYPEALFVLAGAGTLMLILLGVDVVIGPLLTLIVFNPQKKSLIFDLIVIVLLQLAALAYGVWVMAQSRPVFLVGVNDQVILVSATDIHPDDLARAERDEFKQLSWSGPRLVGAKPPEDPEVRENLVFESLRGGPDLHQLPRFYVPYEEISASLLERGKQVSELPDAQAGLRERIRAELKSRGIDEADARILLLRGRKGFGTMVLSRTTGLPILSIPEDPDPAANAPADSDTAAPATEGAAPQPEPTTPDPATPEPAVPLPAADESLDA